MDNKKNNKTAYMAVLVVSAVLAATALILIGYCIFSDTESSWVLPVALGCTIMTNLLNIARAKMKIRTK